MNVLSEIETAVMSELDKLKEKLEAFTQIKNLEAEIEKWKAKLEGDTDPTSAVVTAGVKVSAVINNAQPTFDVPEEAAPQA